MERRIGNGDLRSNGGPTPAPRLNGTLPNRSNYAQHVHNLSMRHNSHASHNAAFNASAYSTVSKHSQTSGSVSPGQTATTRTTGLDQSRDQSLPTVDVSALTALNASAATRLDATAPLQTTLPTAAATPAAAAIAAAAAAKRSSSFCERLVPPLPRDARVKRMLCCLGLLCLSSLLLAILAAIFLLKVTPLDVDEFQHLISGYRRAVDAHQYIKLYEVTVALSALSVCLNLCCLLVCAIQFVLCIKLSKPPGDDDR